MFGEGVLAPVTADGKAAAVAAEDNAAKLLAAAAGDLRQAAILQYDGAVGEKGAFEKLPLERQQQLLYNARTIPVELRSRAGTIPLACEQLRALMVPALLVRGERTAPYQRHRYEATIGCLPRTAEATIIPGAPPAWQIGNPEASAKAILAFLAKH